LLRLLTERQQNICVVGDDDQSIYAWRGADPTHILEFGHHFPGAHAITLDQNYRSTSSILDAANHVIAKNSHRHPKRLWSDRGVGEPISEVILEEDRAESEFVADEIERRAREQTRPWKDFAILYRSNTQARVFEEALRMRRIPYKIVGGMSFLDRKEIKDVLSYWRLIVNPKDDGALRRVINWPSRGLGKTSIEALGTHAFQNQLSLFDALAAAATVAPRGAEGATTLRTAINELRSELEGVLPTAAALAEWARRSLDRLGIRKGIEEDSEDPVQGAKKWETVEELVHSIGQLKPSDLPTLEGSEFSVTGAESASSGSVVGEAPPPVIFPGDSVGVLREFLARMTLEAQSEEEDSDSNDGPKNQVTLLTLHGAKGLEYPIVFLVGMEEGLLPHQRSIEEARDYSEERRLCYVGITRARDHLVLTRAKTRVRFGKPVPRTPSRFLEEIPQNLLIRRDESLNPDFNSKQAREEHEAKVKGFLDQIRGQIGGST
jgi:superfamily I DNA/RNA helicase